MLIALDKYGSITIPGPLRQQLGLDEETYFELTLIDGGDIHLHPVTVQRTIRLNEKGLKKLDEARNSGTGELPYWMVQDMENATAESNQ